MLQLIITATLLITGLFAQKEPKSQPTLSVSIQNVSTNCPVRQKVFPQPESCYQFNDNSDLYNENESETI